MRFLGLKKIFSLQYLYFLKQDLFTLEYKSKNTITAFRFALLNHSLIIAILVLFANAIYRYCNQGLNIIVLIDLVGGVFFLGLTIWFNIRKNIEFIGILMSSMMVVMGMALLSSKHVETTIYIWTYTIPIVTVFISGYKKGFSLSITFYLFALWNFWYYYDFWHSIHWDYYAMIRYFITSFILLELCIIADFVSCSLQDKLYAMSSTDSLTRLYNRQKIEDMLTQCVEHTIRFDQNLSICIFDIDDFKSINDTYGHLMGDEVLKGIAKIILSNIRQVDKVGRWGGEEFFLILPNTDTKTATEVVYRLKIAISSHKFNIDKKVTCSFGLALFDTQKSEDENIIKTDNALYKAKTSGKNKICVSD